MKRLASILLGGLTILYPLIALAMLRHVPIYIVLIVLLVALGLRLWLGGKSAPFSIILASISAIIGISVTAIFDQELSLRLYPVFMAGAMLVAFLVSLIRGPSMIERFARLAEPELPDHAIGYTYKVTVVWCAFIAINLVIALWTVFYASMEVWSIYNGLIAYVLMAVLFIGELVFRKFIWKPKES